MDRQYQRLGDILIAQGLINAAQLKEVLKLQTEKGLALGKMLTRERIITEEALARALAFQKNLDLVDLSEYDISMHAAALVNEEVARRYKIIPIDFDGGKLVVAVANPLDVHAIDSMKMITGYKIETVVATETSIEEAIGSYLVGPSQIQETVEEAAKDNEDEKLQMDALDFDEDDGVPVVKLATMILTKAFRERASDVHIECGEKIISVRYRVDGVLREAMTIPRHLKALLVSRIKIMAEMDITERRLPQDGRVGLEIDGKNIEFRVATLPGLYGENVVLRLLTGGKTLIKLESLGMSQGMLAKCRVALSRSHGALLVTGPTGSGKTTSLYGMLNELNKADRKIITIEDPIETPMAGLNQMQINRKAGLDFAQGLRAILRSDPDIVMVGEIRDFETAQIAIRGALTGHLVLSSLHTNDSASAITRLVDMGLDAYFVASSVQCIVAQRLARVLCPYCKLPVDAREGKERLANLGYDHDGDEPTLFAPKGCRKCQNTGYHGRIGVFELLLIDEEIGKLCVEGASSAQIKQAAIANGMQTLLADGLSRVAQGLISIDEVQRVIF